MGKCKQCNNVILLKVVKLTKTRKSGILRVKRGSFNRWKDSYGKGNIFIRHVKARKSRSLFSCN